ncbi:sigma-70 family RNA polymerase sigma factor [Streptomyces typhae]|uniref:sigma-70 family RNA polymerase sigma factor n=1 Tax=Streptomyces typhae TaxID=2681492 RepID=UPI0031B6019E
MEHDRRTRGQIDDVELTALVTAARAGNAQARHDLAASFLPLVYNVVGRALGGHADVDDTVQDVMVRMLRGLPGLRDPASFRSWLVAIAMNETRRHQRPTPVDSGLQDACDVPDPAGDFTDVTILRLGLSGERKQVAQATRWMDDDYRELLALWWLEAAGELSRTEIAEALGLTTEHTAVRVQRMKAQLVSARTVVRALAAAPRCPGLTDLTASWDGVPSALWRKRLARHTRACAACTGHGARLTPAEGLLAGLALVPPLTAGISPLTDPAATAPTAHAHPVPHPDHQQYSHPADDTEAIPHTMNSQDPMDPQSPSHHWTPDDVTAITPPSSGTRGSRAELRQGRRTSRRRKQAVAAGAGIAAIATLTAVMQLGTDDSDAPDKSTAAAMRTDEPTPGDTEPSRTPEGERSPSASPSKSKEKPKDKEKEKTKPTTAAEKKAAEPERKPRSTTKTGSKKPKPPPAPPRTQRPSATATPRTPTGSTEQQVLRIVNDERQKAGCRPLTYNSKLATAAKRHSTDMKARNYFDHTSPDGTDPGKRITAAGYRWSTYGENIARGQQSASSVMTSWMNSEGHRANILNCSFKELGVGIERGSGGPWWTQNFGAR